jgi:hypothetical protein
MAGVLDLPAIISTAWRVTRIFCSDFGVPHAMSASVPGQPGQHLQRSSCDLEKTLFM